jgi:methionyl-tRNA synthetase
MDTISYEQFAALDIRVGTITAVAVVPEADKLIMLTVDIGEAEPRQIISGIRTFFADPQELVGKQCPFLANLTPRMIKGLESQGMILAIGDDLQFSLLHPAVAVAVGSKVR